MHTNNTEKIRIFFEKFYKDAQGYLSIWRKDSKTTNFFNIKDELSETVDYCRKLSCKTDVYFGLGLRKKQLNKMQRGKEDDIVCIPCLWLDIDIHNPDAHSRQDYPKTPEEALHILSKLGLDPSIVINSGNGLHIYWLLKEPFVIKTIEDKERIKKVCSGFNILAMNKFKEAGYHIDNVSDLARVLRVPGTLNHKGTESKNVEVIKATQARYDISEIEKLIESNQIKENKTSTIIKEDTKPEFQDNIEYAENIFDLVKKRCRFISHCVDDAATLSEPEWYKALSICTKCKDGYNKSIEISKNHPEFNIKQTVSKIYHADNAAGPATCQKIQDDCGDSYCRDCQYNGYITSPIQLGVEAKIIDRPYCNEQLNINHLPDVWERFTDEAVKSLHCPYEYIVAALLGYTSGLIGNYYRIKIKEDWSESAGLYIAIVGSPASKKTPAINMVGKYVRKIESDNKLIYKAQMETYEGDLSEYKENQKNNSKKRITEPEKPKHKRIIIHNVTTERLCQLLEENKKGLIQEQDELAALINSFDQYRGGKGSDREFYLLAFDNLLYTVDRKNLEESIVVEKPYITIIGGIQPDKLRKILGESKNVNDGFIERICFTYPEKNTDTSFPEFNMSEEIKTEIWKLFKTLNEIEYNGKSEFINLSPEAYKLFKDWQEELSRLNIVEKVFPSVLEGAIAKMDKITARIALVIHIARYYTEETDCVEELDATSMKYAISMAKYFISQAYKVYTQVLHQNMLEGRINKVISWIKRRKEGNKANWNVLNSRELEQGGLIENSKDGEPLIKMLYDYGYGISFKSSRGKPCIIIFDDTI